MHSDTTDPPRPTSADRILRMPAVRDMTGLADSTIYLLVQRGDFPAPRRLTQRASGWRESDVLAWIASRPTAVDAASDRMRRVRAGEPMA